MSGISSPGVGSGLPISDLVSQLVAVEIDPIKGRINKQGARMSTELSALGQIKSSLGKLQDTLVKLSDINRFYGVAAKVSDTSILNAKLSDKAQAGNYDIKVEQLATRHSLASDPIADPSASVGTGSINITFGSYNADKSAFTENTEQPALNLDITSGNDSLSAIRDQINASDSDVHASIINDSQGARLTLSSARTGENMAMRITVNEDAEAPGLAALAYDPTAGNDSMNETVSAQNSHVKINGLLLDNYSNELGDAIEGVTLNLKKADINTTVNLSISQDKNKMTEAVNQFVQQYNETMSVLDKFTGYNKESEEGGYLQGDSALRSLKNSLASWVGQSLNNGGTLNSLADIGILTGKNGTLEVNTDKFNEALDNHYADIGALFAKTAVSDDSQIRVQQVGRDIPAGTYDVHLDTFVPGSELTGTIDGVYANSSDGRILNGTGKFKGLDLEILGGGTGDRGQVEVRDGLAVMFDNVLESYLGDKGNLTYRTEQLNQRIANLDNDYSALERRAEKIEARYMRQFTALDAMISQMQNTSEFLNQQLASLPDLRINSR